jgi:hypothetical protein
MNLRTWFRRVWQDLASEQKVDEIDSQEFQMVFNTWLELIWDRKFLATWIVKEANRPSTE